MKSNGLMLVGIGASAGGVEALQRFFERMPADSGLAFAVMLHTVPDRESHLAEVLQRKTRMPVSQVTEPVRVERNHVYCVPPDRQVSVSGGHVRLGASDAASGRHVPIDLFFRTLADAYRDRAIAVVLSGSGADGSLGLGRVREEGGVSIAQDPSEAEHSAMPRNAIETGFVDFILPVEAMAEKLVSLGQNAGRIQLPPAGDQESVSLADDSLREVLALLRARTRHDFTSYKRTTLLRRIERRLQVTESRDIPEYLKHVRKQPEELQALLRDLLISVTNFFRDPEAFRCLENDVVPRLFDGKDGGDHIRVWASGCATGEEAYSLAMLLAERADKLTTPPTLQVFATDIDDGALAHARAGVYPSTIVADVSPERLKRFFTREGQYYRVKRGLREAVLFAPHNILRDPAFSKLDLVSCRNLLIYINRNMQERILEIFHFALRPDGYLFLGTSESAEGLTELFTPVHKKYRIFQRHQSDDGRYKVAPQPPFAGPWGARLATAPQTPPSDALGDAFSFGELHYRTLEAFAPPSVLVNADYDIVHLSEHAGRYLRLGGGEPSRNLLRAAHPDLRLELRSLLITAARGGPVSSRVLVNLEGGQHFVRVVVRPLVAPQVRPGFMLVVFEEADEAAPDAGRGAEEHVPVAARTGGGLEPIVRQLEEDLHRTREQLRATVEENETSTEELKAANEELQAMNEELRSASEEMETGKEEMQSVNEELTTLNHELREKVEEIGRSNSDLQNLIASTRIATLFLDRNLRLKRYTPSAQELFNIIPGDTGRPLTHITHKLDYPALAEDAERVIRDLRTVEREVSTTEGRFFLARLLPYRTTDDKINGVVLTFTDIHEHRRAEERLQETLAHVRLATDAAQAGWGFWDLTTGAARWDERGRRIIGFADDAEAATRQGWFSRIHPEDLPRVEAHFAECLAGDKDFNIEFRVVRADGEARLIHASGRFRKAADGTPLTGTGLVIDITEHRRGEEQTRLAAAFNAFSVALADALRPLTDPAEIQAEAARLLGERLGASRALYFETVADGDGDYYVVKQDYHAPGVASMIGRHRAGDFGVAVTEALRAGHTLAVADTATTQTFSERERATYLNADIRAFVAVPLVKHERHVASVAVHQAAPRAWTAAEVALIEETAERTWAAVERARAEEALRASEERLRLVIETAEDYAIMLMDSAGRFTNWNTGAQKMFSYTEAEAVGQSAALIFTPEDRTAGVPELELRIAGRDGRAADERWHLRKGGERFYVSGVMVSLGHGRGYAKIARDLTAQKQAQDDLQKAWEQLERRVEERTAELAEANSAMRAEVSERRRAEQERLELLRRIVSTQEDERRRISRELHDQLGQSLTALRLKLEGLKDEAGRRSKLRGRIEELAELAERLDADVDFLAWELRPSALDDLGLIVALSNYAQEWSKHFGVEVNFHSAGLGDARLASLVEISLYRIAQEALNNVSKHAEAASVDLLLERRDGHAVLIVEDNGRGFDAEQAGAGGRGMGLIGMRERAALVGGSVEIESAPGRGTTLFVRLPATPAPADPNGDGGSL